MAERDPIKVYDARWQVAEFDDAAVRRLFEATLAYGRELGVGTITLCRDARLGTGRVMEIGLAVAIEMGFRVYCCPDAISTPQSYFATHQVCTQYPKTMGLTITASHNPADYVGVKFTVPTVQAIGQDCGPEGGLTRIRALYHAPTSDPAPGHGTLTLIRPTEAYIDFSLNQAGLKPGDLDGLRVVVDGFHGSAGPELFDALTRAGATVLARRLVPDGNFPSGSPNPTSQNKMDDAVRLASEQDAHAVIGLDGDGDRIVFGDRRGILSAGFASVAILREANLAPPGASEPIPVLYDPKVNPLALAEWGKLHVKPVLFRNGHSQIKDYMRTIEAPFAAEESGHYYHRITLDELAVTCENSILTVGLFLRALKDNLQLMDELWALEDTVSTTGEFNYQFADDHVRDEAMAAVIQMLIDEGAQTVTATPDGIDLQGTVLSKGVQISDQGVVLSDAWYSGYMRIATNEPAVVRSYFSTGRADQTAALESQVRTLLASKFGGSVIE